MRSSPWRATHDVPVMEDAAHALPARYRGRRIGTLGDLTVFSFYATKNLTTGEGGMVTTRDARAGASASASRRLHGMNRDAWKRYSEDGSWRYDVAYPGFKYNMTDMNAALGLVQLSACRHCRPSAGASSPSYRAALARRRRARAADLPARCRARLASVRRPRAPRAAAHRAR